MSDVIYCMLDGIYCIYCMSDFIYCISEIHYYISDVIYYISDVLYYIYQMSFTIYQMSSTAYQKSKCVTPHLNCCLSIRKESSIFRSNRPGWNFNEYVRLSFKFGVFLEFIIKILPWGGKLQLINCFVAAPAEMAEPNSV